MCKTLFLILATMTVVQSVSFTDVAVVSATLYLAYALYKGLRGKSGTSITTPLKGPERDSWFFGVTRKVMKSEDPAAVYEEWFNQFGNVMALPAPFGRAGKIVLGDPKAIAHFYQNETTTYVNTRLGKIFISNMLGHGLLTSEGESHKRQRKALTPAFSNAAIRRLTSVFYDSSYKGKDKWDAILDANGGEATIEVQKWMNHISLDSIGIAGFGHEFHSLDGATSPVIEVFESFNTSKNSPFGEILFLLSFFAPWLLNVPTERNKLTWKFKKTMSEKADELLEKTRKEKSILGEESAAEKSIIGLLIKGESTEGQLSLSHEEVMAQNVLLLAGYETTSISLTWALIELSKAQDKQRKLRDELSQFSSSDPTYEQLNSQTALPYLDAVVHEVLRLHPPLRETNRTAKVDDIIPLSEPVTTASGEEVQRIAIAKGATVSAPIAYINRSEKFWGKDAKTFIPERWINEENNAGLKSREIEGYRHLLTFSAGPRTCLGKAFALAEFKAALSVLVRNYSFDFVDGPETKIGHHPSILPRPKVDGQEGARVPLRVRRID